MSVYLIQVFDYRSSDISCRKVVQFKLLHIGCNVRVVCLIKKILTYHVSDTKTLIKYIKLKIVYFLSTDLTNIQNAFHPGGTREMYIRCE